MSSINPVGGNNPINSVYTPQSIRQAAPAEAQPARAADRLELSGVGHLMQTLKSSGDVRTDKIAAIKSAIEAGTYEDDAKLDAAIDKLLDDLGE